MGLRTMERTNTENIDNFFENAKQSMSKREYISYMEVIYIGFYRYMRNSIDLEIALRCLEERDKAQEELADEIN